MAQLARSAAGSGAFARTGVFDDKWQNLNPRRRLVIEWTAQL
jgi:hypothetical protein